MGKRNQISLAIVCVLFTTGFLIYLKFYYPNNQDTGLQRLKIMLFDENYLAVQGDGVKINENEIKVIWNSERRKGKVIWENGEKVGVIGNEYGPQNFEVFYYNKRIGGVSHMKTNNWHTHSYHIKVHFLDAKHTVGFDFRADGPNQKTEKNISESK